MRALPDALLDIYEAAQTMPVAEFGERSFAWLRERLPFDSAALGTMFYEAQGLRYRAFHLHGQPVEKILEYPQVAHLDAAAHALSKNIGKANRFCVNRDLPRSLRNEPMHSYGRRFGVAQSLTYCNRRGGSGEAIALWRGSRKNEYDPGQGRLAETLAPHLFLAMRINTSRFMRAAAFDELRSAVLVANQFGVINAFDERCIQWLVKEWPQWEPPLLPRPLLEAFASAGQAGYHGRSLDASCALSGSVLVIRVRPLNLVPRLTAAQARVAQRLRYGRSYKEVANELGLSPATVRNHAHAAYSKLGVRSKAELAHLLATGSDDSSGAAIMKAPS